MNKLFATLALIAMTTTALPALAFHCPADMKKIDAALAGNSTLSADQMTTVKALRKKGEVEHKSGRHQDSVDTLAEAMKLLGIN